MKQLKIFLSILLASVFTITSLALSESLNLLSNPGFESKSLGNWTAMDSCRVELNNLAKHSGKRSLVFHPLKDGAGIRSDISSVIQPGYKYFFAAWFRNAEAGWGQVDVLLIYQQAGKTRQIPIGRADCNKDLWSQVSKEFFVPEQAEHSGLHLAIKTAWGRIAFLVDDLELRPALQIHIDRPVLPNEPGIVLQMGPHSEKRNKLKVHVEVFNHRQQVVKQFDQPLDAAIRPALTDGFYRVVATTQDLDARRFEDEKIYYLGALVQLRQNLENQSNEIVFSESLAPYHGWIRYLQYLSSYYQKREGEEADRTLQALFRLAQWTQTIRENPAAIDTLSGVQEWAYLSRVDDSGQPFKLAISSPYDSRKTYPLVVVMHGYGGNHLEYSGAVTSNPDYFELHVLGRARGGWYRDLSEADVLDVVDYVRKNWRIDDRRIHLTGTSMGGGGTFQLASRYPDRWASARPVCGSGADLPIRNCLHVPYYSTHSVDDPTVPVLTSRAPLLKLMAAGGQVIIDETIGLQHAAWNYAEGNNRALKWMRDQVRPETREVRLIDYTAVDRFACAAYWLKVAEWGQLPGPARFKATAGPQNQLYLNLENIRTLQIHVPQSPFDPRKDLKISVNAKVFITVNAPLPDSIFVTEEKGNWFAKVEWTDRPSFVLHTPGGVHNLYHHEPLLIVYGTNGDETSQRAMAQAAFAASKSPNPMWVGDEGDIKDGVPNHQLLYGHLKMKPDTAVTESDLRKYNLVLIGKAEENQIVRKMQNQLPVQFGKEITCSDGMRFPGEAALMGLYFYNPLAPMKLIYWVAADNSAAYRPYNLLLQLQNNNPCGTDLLVIQENPIKIVKVRHFDSRWNWSKVYENSAKVAEQENTFGKIFERIAEAIRKATGADFTLQAVQAPPELQAGVPGITQWADFASLDLTTPIAVMKMKGALILSHQKGFAERESRLRFYPTADMNIDPDGIYQVALSALYPQIQQLINLQNHVPDSFEILDMTQFEAMKRILF
ncbi:MAG: carbohydrate binding domain-containing protein [candidate division KSB1 bacterium]|nr:carbohydrate binding domain-containing protein [candidate division KSB1 bacterium]MDZ7300552.1 carbohydrate binding domain-containing protein [candidate division KSB1 bacterium]MDZ7309691.1 carbohydrate binding domain-containing protein [candidate division KSB1 bacterium]